MFRSQRRPVVYPQAEHARIAATIAAAWGNDAVAPPPLPLERFVHGVARHDRGYGDLDADGIGEVESGRWLELQRRSFAPEGEDPVVDLVVALHVQRLVARSGSAGAAAAAEELAAALPALREAAGVREEAAGAADRITDLCDRVAFDFCFERPREGAGEVAAAGGGLRRVISRVDGHGRVTLSPWPLAVPRLVGVAVGYRAETYPRELAPVVELYRVEPS